MIYRFGLLGFPLEHSRSPQIHQAFLEGCGLEGEYRLYPVPGGAMEGLRKYLAKLQRGELHGLNVTIPHKEAVARMVDGLTPRAKATAAVNTLWAAEGAVWGDNTDVPAFWEDLREKWPAAVTPSWALVLGAGGAARAVTFALREHGWKVLVAARTRTRAERLCAQMDCVVVDWERREEMLGFVSLVVNATPVGMYPKANASPLRLEGNWPPGVVVYDLVYNPTVTKLISVARAAGALAFNGFGMLKRQAALAFYRWTGCAPPL